MTATDFRPGDVVRENRQTAPARTVLEVCGNVLYTTRGPLHATKAVRVAGVAA